MLIFARRDQSQWALAALYAYRTYGGPELLGLATDGWNTTSAYLISPEDADSGTHPTKNSTFSKTCNGGMSSFFTMNGMTLMISRW